ncbi:ABC transporter permease subunit [bacterium]|nr:ABC transporter permease subunit [bacterium]
MHYIKTIAQKEFSSFFKSPAAYMVLVGFLVITGWFFAHDLFLNNYSDIRDVLSFVPTIYLIFIPAITMGLVSKENYSGTIELLSTLPVKSYQIVTGKFFAGLGLIMVGILFSLIHPFTIMMIGTNVDVGTFFTGYLGLILLASAYTAIGLFASCLTKNPIIAFIVSFVIMFFFFILQYALFFIPSSIAGIFQYLSVNYHYSNLIRGVIDTRNIIYFVSLTFVFLFLAGTILDLKKR